MSIWTKEFSLNDLNTRWATPLTAQLGMQIIEILPSGLIAEVDVQPLAQQPFGAWHGGMTCYLAESLASLGSNLCIGESEQAVGMALTATHLRPTFQGKVRLELTLRHRGRRTHLWAFELFDGEARLMSVGTMTTAVAQQNWAPKPA